MSRSIEQVCVVIPARNEEALLPRCLRSVLAAREELTASGVGCAIVVAVDRSTDKTCEIARRMVRQQGKVIRTEVGVVGRTRALAVEVGLARWPVDPSRCWLANTDADCVVPQRWLVDQVLLAERGVQAVAGIVGVDGFEEHAPWVAERFRTTYLVGRDGTHPHVHGANLGVRADVYLRAGGWGPLATAEDHDLWRRLGEQGCRRESVASLKVVTSGRRVGRAPLGFAGALAAHNELQAAEPAA